MTNKFINQVELTVTNQDPNNERLVNVTGIDTAHDDGGLVNAVLVTTHGELVKVTANTPTQVTVDRSHEGTTKTALVAGNKLNTTLSAGQLKLNEGEIDQDLVPDTNITRNIGSAAKRLAKVHTESIDLDNASLQRASGQSGAVTITLPNASGRILTNNDVTTEEPGCEEGMFCVESDGTALAATYKLMGGDRGNVVVLLDYPATGTVKMVAHKKAYLQLLFPNSITYNADGADGYTDITITTGGASGTKRIEGINFVDEDTNGKWAELSFTVPAALNAITRAEWLAHVKGIDLTSAQAHDPGGRVAIGGDVYIRGNLQVGGVTLPRGYELIYDRIDPRVKTLITGKKFSDYASLLVVNDDLRFVIPIEEFESSPFIKLPLSNSDSYLPFIRVSDTEWGVDEGLTDSRNAGYDVNAIDGDVPKIWGQR